MPSPAEYEEQARWDRRMAEWRAFRACVEALEDAKGWIEANHPAPLGTPAFSPSTTYARVCAALALAQAADSPKGDEDEHSLA